MTKRVWLFKSGMNAFVTTIKLQTKIPRTEIGYIIPNDAKIDGV